jgi:SAM-dependent methyltransferase
MNRRAWEHNASFWDETLQEGNPTHDLLLVPALRRLLDLKPGQEVLDVACGNGQDARWIARLGAQVTAFDFARASIDRAIARSQEDGLAIAFHVLDATDPDQLAKLGAGRFDAILCNMVLMDIPSIGPLIDASARLLRAGGRLVFSVTHPCFNTALASQGVERWTNEGGRVQTRGWTKVWGYKTPSITEGVAIAVQPHVQLYFDRPLDVLLGAFFSRGFVMDALDEPAFPEDTSQRPSPGFASLPEIPPVLVARMRPA